MDHDFRNGSKCRFCGVSQMFADTKCSGNMDEASDEAYDRDSDS